MINVILIREDIMQLIPLSDISRYNYYMQ